MEERHEQAHACEASASKSRSAGRGPVGFNHWLSPLPRLRLISSRSCLFGKGGIFVLCISAKVQGDAPIATKK